MDGSLSTTTGTGRPARALGVGRSLRRALGTLGGVLVLALALAACSSNGGGTGSSGVGSGAAANGARGGAVGVVGATVVHRQLVIENGSTVPGRTDWPHFVPSGFSAPAGATIVLTIVNHDDGAAPLPPASPWGKVMGADPTFGAVSGGEELVDGKPVTSVPNAQVSHTFTIPGLLVNIPIPAAPSASQPVTVTFSFTVTKAGTYNWLCVAPCGSGSSGMGGAMDAEGWMEGYVHIT